MLLLDSQRRSKIFSKVDAVLASQLVRGNTKRISNQNPNATRASTCHLSLLGFNRMVPQHTHPIECNISCKRKIFLSGRKTYGRHFRQSPTHWTTPSSRILRLGRAMFVTKALQASEHPYVDQEWMAIPGWPLNGWSLKSARISDAVLRVSSLRMAVILNKMIQCTFCLMFKTIILFAQEDYEVLGL